MAFQGTGDASGSVVKENKHQRRTGASRLRAAKSSTAVTCSRVTSNCSIISSMLIPSSRFSKMVATGRRAPRKTHAPLPFPATLSPADHFDQSNAIGAPPSFYSNGKSREPRYTCQPSATPGTILATDAFDCLFEYDIFDFSTDFHNSLESAVCASWLPLRDNPSRKPFPSAHLNPTVSTLPHRFESLTTYS